VEQLQILFGSKAAAYVLLFIEAYGSGHAARIASTFDTPLSGIQRQLLKFETNGILVSRLVGKTRVFEFNPRSPLARNLKQFLAIELDNLPRETYQQYFYQRQRPRRTGKKRQNKLEIAELLARGEAEIEAGIGTPLTDVITNARQQLKDAAT